MQTAADVAVDAAGTIGGRERGTQSIIGRPNSTRKVRTKYAQNNDIFQKQMCKNKIIEK